MMLIGMQCAILSGMRNAALLTLSLLSACGVETVSPQAAIKHATQYQGALKGRDAEAAMAMDILSQHYGQDVRAALATLPVTIAGTSKEITCGKLTSSVAGCSHLGDPTRAEIEVFMLASTRVADSALIHELAHTARHLIEGSSDGAHSDGAFWSLVSAAEDDFAAHTNEPVRY